MYNNYIHVYISSSSSKVLMPYMYMLHTLWYHMMISVMYIHVHVYIMYLWDFFLGDEGPQFHPILLLFSLHMSAMFLLTLHIHTHTHTHTHTPE